MTREFNELARDGIIERRRDELVILDVGRLAYPVKTRTEVWPVFPSATA